MLGSEAAVKALSGWTWNRAAYVVGDVQARATQRKPTPPFTTSTLQQEASRQLGFTARRTMAVAQQLYEGIDVGDEGSVGLITYMRTDSTNIAEIGAGRSAPVHRRAVRRTASCPPSRTVYKTKAKGAQEAHEAIRPTSVLRQPQAIKEFLNRTSSACTS